MYHANNWDEDKLNIQTASFSHSKYGSIFSSDSKNEIKYHEQKYGEFDSGPSGDYMKLEKGQDADEKKKDLLEFEEEKKADKITEEELPFRAATQIFSEQKQEIRAFQKKSDKSTIEDAITRAISQEKKVIFMDN